MALRFCQILSAVAKKASDKIRQNQLLNGVTWRIWQDGDWRAYARMGGKNHFARAASKQALLEKLRSRSPKIASFGKWISPADAAAFAEAKTILQGTGAGLIEAARFYVQHRPPAGVAKVAELAQQFLESREDRSKRYRWTLHHYMIRITEHFGQRGIGEISTQDIERALDGVGGARTRNNYRAAWTTLFRFAQSRGFLPEGKTAPERVTRARIRHGEKSVIPPEWFWRLYEMAPDDQCRVWLLLGGLAGIRSAEIERITPNSLHWDTGWIALDETQTKGHAQLLTGRPRLIPLRPELASKLEPLMSKLSLLIEGRPQHRMEPIARALLGRWPRNGLRDSYISYRVAEIGDVARVADECGNSPQEIYRSYRSIRDLAGNLVTPDQAKKWFSGEVVPRGPASARGARTGTRRPRSSARRGAAARK